MRILMLAPELPYPLHAGGVIRSFNVMQCLASEHEVVLLAGVARDDGTRRDDVAALRRACARLVAVHLCTNGESFEALAWCVAHYGIQSLHVDGLVMARYALHRPTVPVVLSQHNAEYLAYERMAAVGRADPSQIGLVRDFERLACLSAVVVITVSQSDREALRLIAPEGRYLVVENGVDIDRFRPKLGLSGTGPPTLVYTGLMSYPPNVDAVRYFSYEVLPRVLRALPECRFVIVGSEPGEEVLRLEREVPGVTVTGRVRDVREYLAAATAVVVPLRAGGGTRHKILEAMAMGKAVVTTGLGCEGLAVRAGQDVLVADTSTMLADSVLQVLTDSVLRNRLGDSARERVVRRYRWDRVLRPLRLLYRGRAAMAGLDSGVAVAGAASE